MADALTAEADAPAASRALRPVVVLRGAAWGLLLGVPGAFLNAANSSTEVTTAGGAVRTDTGSSGALVGSFLLVVAAFALAGFTAGVEAPADRVRHGVLAALAALVPVELVVIIGRLDRGAEVRLGTIFLTAALAVAAGYTGARLAGRVPEKQKDTA